MADSRLGLWMEHVPIHAARHVRTEERDGKRVGMVTECHPFQGNSNVFPSQCRKSRLLSGLIRHLVWMEYPSPRFVLFIQFCLAALDVNESLCSASWPFWASKPGVPESPREPLSGLQHSRFKQSAHQHALQKLDYDANHLNQLWWWWEMFETRRAAALEHRQKIGSAVWDAITPTSNFAQLRVIFFN